MPTKKDGSAGSLQAPVDPAEAQDSLDGQSGVTEDAIDARPDRGSQTMSVSSVMASAEQTADPYPDEEALS
jgi:hypothetical protein